MEFIVPGIQIDESDVGTRVTNQVSLSTIGIVGTFQRGPVNTPITIGDDVSLATVFGDDADGLTGWKSFVGAYKQGANDFRIVRVVGTGAAAGKVTMKDGQATSADSVIISANSVGDWGNSVKIGVVNHTDTFDLCVKYGGVTETFKSLTLDTLPSISSNYVVVAKVEGASAIPKATDADVALAGGSDGSTPGDTDYIGKYDSTTGKRTGLYSLEAEQVGIVLCAQQHSKDIHVAMLTFCKACGLDEGRRVAILNTDKGLSVDSASAVTTALDSDRGIMAYPWVKPELATDFVAPDGYYAGRLATLNIHESPSNKQIIGITATEHAFTYAQVKKLTLAKISPITAVRNRGFRIRNGVNLCSDTAWSQTNIRRWWDKFEMELYDGLQWAVSEPHDKPLWDSVADQVDMLLSVEKRLGYISDYLPTICNDKTNPPEMVANRILTFIPRVKNLYAADFIVGKMKRILSTEGGN